MKNILLIIALALTVSACQKKTCWKCVTQISYSGTTNVPPGSVTNTQVCDKTKSEIREYEKTGTANSTSGSITVRQSTTCTEN